MAWAPAAASAQSGAPTPGPPTTIDGPNSSIASLNGMSIARDGTGGLVYLAYVAGQPRVLVSRLVGGQFKPPQEVDASLGGGSSQPVIAASNNGLLLVAFINSGSLYVVTRPSTSAPFSQPRLLASAASNPSIQANVFGKAYLAFTVGGSGGSNVRCAYYDSGQWTVESAPLNASPGDGAGAGLGRPRVATAGDGIAIVAWGEAGHIYTRRVWGDSPSVVLQQADIPSIGGWGELSADQPDLAVGGNSSWVGVVYDETVGNGSQQQSRVLFNRLQGGAYNGAVGADVLTTPGPEGATDPQIAMAEYGNGLVSSARQSSNQVITAVLGLNGSFGGSVFRADSLPNSSPPYAVPGVVGLNSLVLAWQHDGGFAGGRDIRARYFTVNSGYFPEQVVSSPSWGPTNAANGIAAGGDQNGDAAVAWVQGTPGAQRIVVGQMYQPPGKPVLSKYARGSHPVLSWQPPPGAWGPMRYVVRFAGRFVGTTSATSLTVRRRFSAGLRTITVTATNPAGFQSPTAKGQVLIDTVKPQVSFQLRTNGKAVAISLQYTDRPPGTRYSSGVGSIVIRWGDGSVSHLAVGQTRRVHFYRRAGSYRVRVIVADRAGNTTRQAQQITIS